MQQEPLCDLVSWTWDHDDEGRTGSWQESFGFVLSSSVSKIARLTHTHAARGPTMDSNFVLSFYRFFGRTQFHVMGWPHPSILQFSHPTGCPTNRQGWFKMDKEGTGGGIRANIYDGSVREICATNNNKSNKRQTQQGRKLVKSLWKWRGAGNVLCHWFISVFDLKALTCRTQQFSASK